MEPTNYKAFEYEDGKFPKGEDYDYEIRNAFEFKSRWSKEDPAWIADDCGDYFWNNCDGWESAWPLNFCILDKNDNEVGRFSVEMEMEATFHSQEDV